MSEGAYSMNTNNVDTDLEVYFNRFREIGDMIGSIMIKTQEALGKYAQPIKDITNEIHKRFEPFYLAIIETQKRLEPFSLAIIEAIKQDPDIFKKYKRD
jgi:hypothetical protein